MTNAILHFCIFVELFSIINGFLFLPLLVKLVHKKTLLLLVNVLGN